MGGGQGRSSIASIRRGGIFSYASSLELRSVHLSSLSSLSSIAIFFFPAMKPMKISMAACAIGQPKRLPHTPALGIFFAVLS